MKLAICHVLRNWGFLDFKFPIVRWASHIMSYIWISNIYILMLQVRHKVVVILMISWCILSFLQIFKQEISSLLLESVLHCFEYSRDWIAKFNWNSTKGIFCLLIDVFIFVLKKNWDQLEVIEVDYVMHRWELELASWFIEIKQRHFWLLQLPLNFVM